jgi:UrcA family protein
MNTIVNNQKNIIGIAVAAAALCAALAAGARADEVPQVHVSYADLNLGTRADAAVLYQRIRAAAARVCALPVESDLGHVSQTKACMARVTAEAVAAVDNANLSRTYAEKMGTTPALQLAVR